ncbi:hypothetical protein AB0F72_02300 [Actinoplanes sp. NPDC023936]|uniref:hypothetical protein n=1 Tax=Actinoplanes sp. NPDC023936 TaxID=3154910 RepID=UPI0033C5BB2F
MADTDRDPLRDAAQRVADCWSQGGYAFVEDDRIDGLATTLRAFLHVAAIPMNEGAISGMDVRGVPRA